MAHKNLEKAPQTESRVLLKNLKIKNLGPIIDDEIEFANFTYLVGRNNAGKSHYLRAIELLLASKNPTEEEIRKIQNDRSKEISIEAIFEGVSPFTSLVTTSNHKKALDELIQNDQIRVIRTLVPGDSEQSSFGVLKSDGTIHNPSGFTANLLKILPEPISIVATADTVDELQSKANTALSKLKRETMGTFFEELKAKTKEALSTLDQFLNSSDSEHRSLQLRDFETRFKEELSGEFAHVIPQLEFSLPDEELIAKEMRIFLDDGHRSEVEQKGHGLQRAALLALLRMLAKHGKRYQDKPSPIFLIGELETFLHPFAQKQLANTLNDLVSRYQIVTTTHSPFIISSDNISGYRRVCKFGNNTKVKKALSDSIDFKLIARHLDRRGNLEGLFADRIILTEGRHDEGFYLSLCRVFNLKFPTRKFGIFTHVGGKEELRQARRFYLQMGFDDVSILCDLDYAFSNDAKNLLKEVGQDENAIKTFRSHIGWNGSGDPSLEVVIDGITKKGNPQGWNDFISAMQKSRIFFLEKGAPEMYYKAGPSKDGWEKLQKEEDLIDPSQLRTLMGLVMN